MRWKLSSLLPVLLLAACGHHDHPLAGNWSQELPDGKEGLSIEFDGKSDKVMVHTAPRADGGHDHLHGTYAFDAVGMTVTVKASLAGDGKADSWSGTLHGEHLELTSADGKLTFHHGGDAHDH